MRVRVIATILGLALLINAAHAAQQKYRNRDDVDGIILLGQDYAFILKEPNGWNLDSSDSIPDELQAVLYRDGSTWKGGIAVMYVSVTHKDDGQKTLKQIIENDIKGFRKTSKYSTVSAMSSLSTADKKKVTTKYFYDAGNKNYESVAYIDEPKAVVIIALSSRDKKEYSNSLPAFKDLVASYFFVSELVNAK